MLDYVVVIEGLRDADFQDAGAAVRRNAARAVNYALRRTRTRAAKKMRQQIAWNARYLTGAQGGRLQIPQTAKPNNLEGVIRGSDRPTSLARFIRGSKRPGRKGVTVQIKPGVSKKMQRAFVMGLKSGNTGLAIRLREGERVENKKVMLRAAYSQSRFRRRGSRRASEYNIYLLYGPSVDQVFDSVRETMDDFAGEEMEREFLRLTENLV
jgi:hypothetical protein